MLLIQGHHVCVAAFNCSRYSMIKITLGAVTLTLMDSKRHLWSVLCAGISFMAPHINNLYFLTLCQKYGAYFVIRLLFWIKLLLSLGMLLIGVQHMWMVGLFIAR